MKSIAATVLSLSMAGSPQAQTEPETLRLSRAATRASLAGPSSHFTGKVRVAPLFAATHATSRDIGESVSFAPGARSAWHTHPTGQTLVVTAGIGRIQRWGSPAEEIRAGDVVWVPPGQKHWHGAAPADAMSCIAIQDPSEGRSVEWLEKVSAAQYG